MNPLLPCQSQDVVVVEMLLMMMIVVNDGDGG